MTSCTVKALLVLACCWPALASADYAAEKARLRAGAPKDAVLLALQAGVAALGEGQRGEAAALFDQALASIEGMFANTENAARARSLWYEEGVKDYKGEPYERAMAFHYRGLLYLAEGDYENARASFRGGVLQDAFSEEEQYRSDFGSLMQLEGWANQLNGDPAQAVDAYQEVARLHPQWQAPLPGTNVLVVAELGGSPRKLGDGISNHEIVYRRPKRTPERSITVTIDGRAYPLALAEDLYFQASTRGGRRIDRLIDGKVAFQNASETIGRIAGRLAADGSVIQAAYGGGHGNALGAIAAVGAISSIISVNVKPRADVRYWANLPETVHIAALKLAAPPSNVSVQLYDEAGAPVALEQVQVQRWTDKNGNSLVWIKTRH